MKLIRLLAYTAGLLAISMFLGSASLTMSQALIERPISCLEWGAVEAISFVIAGLFYRRRKK